MQTTTIPQAAAAASTSDTYHSPFRVERDQRYPAILPAHQVATLAQHTYGLLALVRTINAAVEQMSDPDLPPEQRAFNDFDMAGLCAAAEALAKNLHCCEIGDMGLKPPKDFEVAMLATMHTAKGRTACEN